MWLLPVLLQLSCATQFCKTPIEHPLFSELGAVGDYGFVLMKGVASRAVVVKKCVSLEEEARSRCHRELLEPMFERLEASWSKLESHRTISGLSAYLQGQTGLLPAADAVVVTLNQTKAMRPEGYPEAHEVAAVKIGLIEARQNYEETRVTRTPPAWCR